MASIGEVGATSVDKVGSSDKEIMPLEIYFGVFFDGTGNNMIPSKDAKDRRRKVKEKYKNDPDYKDEDWDCYVNRDLTNGANEVKYKDVKQQSEQQSVGADIGSGRSNVAILHSIYQGKEKIPGQNCVRVYNIYVEGAGKEAVNEDSTIQNIKNGLGSGWGNGKTGVVALVSKAIRMVRLVLKGYKIGGTSKTKIYFDVFGFSRGATCARLFSYVAGRGGDDSLNCEDKFSKFQAKDYYKDGYLHFLDHFENLEHNVSFLGIFDTVSSIGVTYNDNVLDYGLHSPDKTWVKKTLHLCAVDEFRSHFALTDINVEKEGNIEVFIPGCHADVGGGYQTGPNSFLLNYQASLTSKHKIYVESPEKEFGKTMDISEDSLVRLGWGIKEEIKKHPIRGFLTCNRTEVKAGYSNLPLSIMRDKANEARNNRKEEMFTALPKGRFVVPKELGDFQTQLEEVFKGKTNGRFWVYPGNSYCSEVYQKLRHDYLHFSATDEIATSNTSIVHSPNRVNNTICRIVYHGQESSSSEPSYLCGYN